MLLPTHTVVALLCGILSTAHTGLAQPQAAQHSDSTCVSCVSLACLLFPRRLGWLRTLRGGERSCGQLLR